MVTNEFDDNKTELLTDEELTLAVEREKARDQGHCLILVRGKLPGTRFFIDQPQVTIGRDPDVEISIDDPSMSRRHARIGLTQTGVSVEDLGSSNGTDVNGVKLKPGQLYELSKEDMIKLGNCILKFVPRGELEILLYGELERGAHLDSMTRIYNKGYLLEILQAEFKRAMAFEHWLTILFFDIDHFKKINDGHGHDAGDFVLKELTELVRSGFVKKREVFARFGGEEFVVVLPGVAIDAAMGRAEAIRQAIESKVFAYAGTDLPVTASFGVSGLGESTPSAKELLKAADTALYQSKQSGRNRVTVYNKG